MKVLLRTEGNHRQGMGDVCGSLAIAAALTRHGCRCEFLFCDTDNCADYVRQQGFPAHVAGESDLTLIKQLAPDVIVHNLLDSRPGYLAACKSCAALVVTVDDTGPGARDADLRINPLYRTDDAICDFAYIMLRDVFASLHQRPRQLPDALGQLLVMQGGADTYGFMPRLIASLRTLPPTFSCTVIVGSQFRHRVELDHAITASPLAVTVFTDVADIERYMLAADLAISAAGLSVFELLCLGTPTITVCGERFEDETASRLADLGAVVNLGFGDDLDFSRVAEAVRELGADPQRRRQLSQTGKSLIDGRGSDRIAAAILDASRSAA